MDVNHVHIIGIGGCASSAIAEYLLRSGCTVTGSEQKYRPDLDELVENGVQVYFGHAASHVTQKGKPDIVLFSPAVMALDPNNPELIAAREEGIPLESWEEFIGEYLRGQGKTGVTVSGSEGKGTTAGILTAILRGTEADPLAILGAKMKNMLPGKHSNVYLGKGSTYILEGDEYNRNFHHYHPDINVMINFEYEHPETYKNFEEYSASFATFFNGMNGRKKLILHATKQIVEFIKNNHFTNVTWFGYPEELARFNLEGEVFSIENHVLTDRGNQFSLKDLSGSVFEYFVPALPGYIALNATGAILAARELGLSHEMIYRTIQTFTGMVRRFDVYKTRGDGAIVTDYGHSPESIHHIVQELRAIYPGKKIHLVFHPHLYSRTYNFFDGFVKELSRADRVSLLDIYPAREKSELWADKVSAAKIAEAVSKMGTEACYTGHAENIVNSLKNEINADEITCFMGAGNMDLYYGPLIDRYTV